MENEIKDKLDLINRRIDDNKTMVTTIVSAGGVLFAALAVIFSWNLNSEKADIKDLRKELKQEVSDFLGKNLQQPDLKLFTPKEDDLNDKVIETSVQVNDDGDHYIEMPIVLRNDGNGPSGEVTVKAYTDQNIKIASRASFEKGFYYESYWQGIEDAGIPNMPGGGFVHPYLFTLYPLNANTIKPGLYPVRIKVYYGKNKNVSATFKFNIAKNLTP